LGGYFFLSDSLPFSTFYKKLFSFLLILFPNLGGFRQEVQKYFKIFIIPRFANSPIYQLKYGFQVTNCEFAEGKNGFDKPNSYNSFPLAFIFSLDRVEKIVKDGFLFPQE
jgi:hypothetical protein